MPACLDQQKAILRLVAFANGERGAATTRLRAAFCEAGGWITDVHFFSGLRTTVHFEVSPQRASALEAALDRAGVALDETSRAQLERAASSSDESVQGTLAVVFIHGDADLRHEVPAVPG